MSRNSWRRISSGRNRGRIMGLRIIEEKKFEASMDLHEKRQRAANGTDKRCTVRTDRSGTAPCAARGAALQDASRLIGGNSSFLRDLNFPAVAGVIVEVQKFGKCSNVGSALRYFADQIDEKIQGVRVAIRAT